jgi:hypothetical protein
MNVGDRVGFGPYIGVLVEVLNRGFTSDVDAFIFEFQLGGKKTCMPVFAYELYLLPKIDEIVI